MEQFRSHWTDFHKIWYGIYLEKPAEKMGVLLKSDKNNRYFT